MPRFCVSRGFQTHVPLCLVSEGFMQSRSVEAQGDPDAPDSVLFLLSLSGTQHKSDF
jgi:hypothetical protein